MEVSFDARKLLINSFFMSNLDYSPLVWIFFSVKSLKRIENSQKESASIFG